MARNSEKAMTTLARWRAAHLDKVNLNARRPMLATMCESLGGCEKWRRQVIGEISRKVAQIQNAGLGEFKLRDLNDEINKLIREKGHWEDQILTLGGPDYKRRGPKLVDAQGKEVPGCRGYKYFGAARDLPGVRDLFESQAPAAPKKLRAELMKDINADYYGYRDEDDGLIIPLEEAEEKKAIEAKIAEWKEKKEAGLKDEMQLRGIKSDAEQTSTEERMDDDSEDIPETRFVAHVPVPTQKEVEEALVRRKKMALLQRYASDDLQTDSEETKRLLGLAD
ncbi:hypothetical protein CAPTEDRAFT_169788 [Capitella teleta]|uniref:Pre-mRNA-splicing factor ISY1 n=1 Tax=Capitella teleta TaxID=283909 RepID=R7U7Z8_CAPTE|nr:hypothetical protein CAPTEDRAFT_169788 [Capitella teleta]|eukprot:ELU02475.1 hypothetical protein CAPTEDRAFT_169788 [Capitella teleta]